MSTQNEIKLSKESAEKEFDKLLDYYEIEEEDLGKGQKRALNAMKPIIIKGIQKGKISVGENDSGEFTIKQVLKSGTEVIYKELDGKAKVEMEKVSEDQPLTRCYVLMGYLSGIGTAGIHKFRAKDIARAEAIGTMLLLS